MNNQIDYKKNIQKIAKFIETNFQEEINLDQLAKKSYISIFHFHRIFKSIIGFTPIDYLERIRIQNAIYLLRYTKLKLGDISFEVGFKNQETFSRSFKKLTKFKALEFRKNKIKNEFPEIEKKQIFDLKPIKKKFPEIKYFYLRNKFGEKNISRTWRKLIDLGLQNSIFKQSSILLGIWHYSYLFESKIFDLGILVEEEKNIKNFNFGKIQESEYLIFEYKDHPSNLGNFYNSIYSDYILKKNIKLKAQSPFELYYRFSPFYSGKDLLTKIFIPIE